MARRVSWTNNSSGHLGTRIYRAPTLDLQNLPAPVATVDPVAQGATAEWIDDSGEYGCYAVQDYDASGVSALSAEVCVSDPFFGIQIGDDVEGGVYAGVHTANDIEYHIVMAPHSGSASLQMKTSQTSTGGTSDANDGLANTLAMQTAGLAAHPAASHCINYEGGGFTDWYIPSRNELAMIIVNLSGHPELSEIASTNGYIWSSTQNSSGAYNEARRPDNFEQRQLKDLSRHTRPVRRVAV